jgi:acyl-CoA thioesterase-1
VALASVAALAIVPARAAVGATPTILVVGDSLSAEYGLARGSGWVALLEQRLQREHINATVVNASISGDTTAGGLARLPSLLRDRKPALVVIELGANDALRGLPLDTTRANLAAMARMAAGARCDHQHAAAELRSRLRRASSLFADVARVEGAALVPFMLKGVADIPQAESMFQPDRIHPLASAHPTILANVWPVLAPLLK